MGSRHLFASSLLACLLSIVVFAVTPAASAGSGEKSFRKPGKGAKNFVIDIKRPVRGPRIPLPVGPSYVYYDYPYYYSRGYYPRHIGGYVYYPYYYYYYYYYYRRYYGSYHRGPALPRRQKGT